MNNIYDTANQLEREIRQLPEFKALTEAYGEVKADEEAYQIFKAFQDLQMKLQDKSMKGEEFSEDDAKEAQDMAQKVQSKEVINKMLEKEQTLSLVINDLNRIIMTPLHELYQS